MSTREEQFLVRFVDGPIHGEFWSTRSRLGWPPPPEIEDDGERYVRESYSQITDEQMVGMNHVVRGVVYRHSPYTNGDRQDDVEIGKPMGDGGATYLDD